MPSKAKSISGVSLFNVQKMKEKNSCYLPKRARHSALDVLRLLELAATSRLFSRQYRA
jgi:hypothetical protein